MLGTFWLRWFKLSQQLYRIDTKSFDFANGKAGFIFSKWGVQLAFFPTRFFNTHKQTDIPWNR